MPRRKVQVGKDHVKGLINATPLKAVEELIWNALDSGGDRVEVKLSTNDIGSVDSIEIIDCGPGILPSELDRAFGDIGNSVKSEKKTNPDGRAYHGREGKGRFKALSLCPTAVWESAYKQDGKYFIHQIVLKRDDPDYFEPSDPKLSEKKSTGTTVLLRGIDKGHNALACDDVREKLAEIFAAYLSSYPGLKLIWDGKAVQIDELLNHQETIELLDDSHSQGPASLLILEWKFKPDGKRLHICDSNGFSYHDIPAGVQARGIDYTAYLSTPLAHEWSHSARFVTEDLDDEVKALVDIAKDRIREYIRSRLAEESQSVVQQWKDDNIYPYANTPDDPLEKAEREVFDIVAVQINEQHPSFEKTDAQNKRLTLALVKQALESSPSSLTKILREVVALPEDDQDALAELLERTPLTNLIRAGKIVSDRLDIIQAFEHILFDTDWKKRLLERTQLHRLLVHELWIFGDEYSLGVDDDGLNALLRQHLNILSRTEIAPEVDIKQITGEGGVPDLMLYRRRKVDRDRFEHLVVELKRPSIKLGQDEISQIEKYAFTISDDPRFDTKKCQWEFILLGNELTSFAKRKSTSENLPDGCIHQDNGVRIWILPWAEVLNTARSRYEFFRDRLEIEASETKGLDSLKARYPHLFEGKGVRKGKDLELTAAMGSDKRD